jgi:hypothetical protein
MDKAVDQDHENGLITVEIARPGRGHRASGKACHFFDNGYFKMNQLHMMARWELPLPLPNTGADGTVRRREGARAGADGADGTVRRREGGTACGDGRLAIHLRMPLRRVHF